MRTPLLSGAFAALVVGLLAAVGTPAEAAERPEGVSAGFKAGPWLEDLKQAEQAFAEKYANLDWALREREVDWVALFDETRRRVEGASDVSQARAAFERLTRKLGDGHVVFRWPAGKQHARLPAAPCESLGYDARMLAAPVAALIPGYVPMKDGGPAEFPSGTVRVGHHTVGVIRIGIFAPQGVPALCAAALEALQIPPDTPCDDACADRVEAWAADRMTADLAYRLREVQAAGAEVLLLDLAENGGGTEWAEAAARMVTAIELKSENIGFVRGSHWSKALLDKLDELRVATEVASPEDRPYLLALAERVEGLRREADTACDSKEILQPRSASCPWLVSGLFATGLLAAESTEIRGKSWEPSVFRPAKFRYPKGVWNGPLAVLVDGNTASAAEEFTAVLQDNKAAVVIGAPTAGAGCGHTNGGTPTTLSHSRGVLELPDCARFRVDGTNEVMGIQPDVLIGLRAADGPHRKGRRVEAGLAAVVEQAFQLHRAAAVPAR